MRRFGVRFQSSLRGTLHLGRTNAFFLGGGKALMNSYYAAAERLGIRVMYDTEVVGLDVHDGGFRAATALIGGRSVSIRARAAVIAAGGFESNLEWLREVWGEAADNFIIRGTPYNKGTLLRLMLDAGAQSVGDAHECHARRGRRAGAKVRRRHRHAARLRVARHRRQRSCPSASTTRVRTSGPSGTPSGEAWWPGSRIRLRSRSSMPKPSASSCRRCFRRSRRTPFASLPCLLDLPPDRLETTVAAFNAAVRPGTFDHSVLDDCRTDGLTPEKTHWALRIDSPPFWGYPLRPGITFTYLGLKVDERAQVLMRGGETARNIYAAGEVMAGTSCVRVISPASA